jgi:hypothetical protein
MPAGVPRARASRCSRRQQLPELAPPACGPRLATGCAAGGRARLPRRAPCRAGRSAQRSNRSSACSACAGGARSRPRRARARRPAARAAPASSRGADRGRGRWPCRSHRPMSVASSAARPVARDRVRIAAASRSAARRRTRPSPGRRHELQPGPVVEGHALQRTALPSARRASALWRVPASMAAAARVRIFSSASAPVSTPRSSRGQSSETPIRPSGRGCAARLAHHPALADAVREALQRVGRVARARAWLGSMKSRRRSKTALCRTCERQLARRQHEVARGSGHAATRCAQPVRPAWIARKRSHTLAARSTAGAGHHQRDLPAVGRLHAQALGAAPARAGQGAARGSLAPSCAGPRAPAAPASRRRGPARAPRAAA